MFKTMLRAVKSFFADNEKTVSGWKPKRVILRCEQLEEKVVPNAYTVTMLGDMGMGDPMTNQGDLRWCIGQANANPGADSIGFGQNLSGWITIRSTLAITGDLTISAPMQNISIDPTTQGFSLVSVAARVNCSISGINFFLGFADGVGNNPKNGGAIFNDGNLTVNNCGFSNNRAMNDGGAIFNDIDAGLSVTNCRIENNSAGRDGGGIQSIGTGVSVTNSKFYSDSAAAAVANGIGGAIGCRNGTLSINNVEFFQNSADNGGAIGIINDVTCSIIGSSLHENRAQRGGGIYESGLALLGRATNLTVSHTSIYNNASSTNGGGLYMVGATIATLDTTVTIANNTAPPNMGDGISYDAATCSLYNQATMQNNTARQR